eukprot:g1632.t1
MRSPEPKATESESDDDNVASNRKRRTVKKVERFEIASPKKVERVEYAGGKGTKLGDIPNFTYLLSKCTGKHHLPVALHRLIYGRDGKSTMRRKNLREFSGFEFEEGSKDWDKVEEKLTRSFPWTTLCLRDLFRLLDIDRSGHKDEMVKRVMNFLLKPQVSSNPNLADEQKNKVAKELARRERQTKRKRNKGSSKNRKKRSKSGPKKLSSYILFSNSVRKDLQAANPDMKATEIMKEIGAKWRALNAEDKAKWKKLAEDQPLGKDETKVDNNNDEEESEEEEENTAAVEEDDSEEEMEKDVSEEEGEDAAIDEGSPSVLQE